MRRLSLRELAESTFYIDKNLHLLFSYLDQIAKQSQWPVVLYNTSNTEMSRRCRSKGEGGFAVVHTVVVILGQNSDKLLTGCSINRL